MLGHAPVASTPLSAFGSLQSVSITGSGGVLVGGAATTLRGRAITGSGGVLVGGVAVTKRGRVIVGSGGVRIGGTGNAYGAFYSDPRHISVAAGLSSHQATATRAAHSYTASKPNTNAEAGG